jgi:hypothetical protein
MSMHVMTRAPGVSIAHCHTRFGVQGRAAARLLQRCGVSIPGFPNEIVRWRDQVHFGSGRCLRLGHNEFVLEQDDGSQLLAGVRAALQREPGAHWLVQRADQCLILDGPLWPAELSRVCSFNFEQLRREPHRIAMTLLADVSVTLAREPESEPADPNALAVRLWCDPGYATYLHECLNTLSTSHDELTGDSR